MLYWNKMKRLKQLNGQKVLTDAELRERNALDPVLRRFRKLDARKRLNNRQLHEYLVLARVVEPRAAAW